MPLSSDYIKTLIFKISKKGDQSAFRQLFDHFYPKMIRFADYYLESGIVSDEIVSTVFMNIWDKRSTLAEIERIDSYIFNAVKYKCLNYLRDNKRLHFQNIENEEFKVLPSLENPEGDFLCDELRHNILAAIDNLPPRCKIIFEMVRDNGLKYKEVASLLEISVKTVEVQMGRALTKIRHDLLPYLEEEGFSIKKVPKETSAISFFSIFL